MGRAGRQPKRQGPSPCELRFLQWMHARNFDVSSSITIGTSHDGRDTDTRGVIAVEEMSAGHVLFRIPRSAMLSADKSKLWPTISKDETIYGWNALVVTLMYEDADPRSPWRPYLDMMPQSLNTPPFWTTQERQMLNGTRAVDRANLEGIQDSYTRVVKPFLDKHVDKFPSDASRSFIAYRRWGAIVLAYSFDLGDSMAPLNSGMKTTARTEQHWISTTARTDSVCRAVMVPMADMLNATPTGTSAHLCIQDDGELSMDTIRPIAKGEEVLNTYGIRPNSELLVRYGYTSPGANPCMTSAVSVAELLDVAQRVDPSGRECSRIQHQLRRFRRTGLVKQRTFSSEGPPFSTSETVLPFSLRFSDAAINDRMTQTLEELGRHHKDFSSWIRSDVYAKPESESSRCRTEAMWCIAGNAQLVAQVCQSRLERLLESWRLCAALDDQSHSRRQGVKECDKSRVRMARDLIVHELAFMGMLWHDANDRSDRR